MFGTKKKLILASSIISFISAILSIICSMIVGLNINILINYADSNGIYLPPHYPYVLLVALIISIFIELLAGSLLMVVALSKTPEEFNKKRSIFIAGSVFTILSGVVSIQSILIYIVFGMRDVPSFTEAGKELYEQDAGVPVYQQQYNKAVKQNEQPQQSQVSGVDSLEKKIEALRKLRDNGVITDEEFKSLLSKLL